MRGMVASLLLLAVGLSPVAAQAPAPAAPPAERVVLDLWDAVFLEGGRAGHVHTFTTETDRDGQKLLRTTVELRLTVKRNSDVVQLGMDIGTLETPKGNVVGVFRRQYLGKTKALDLVGTVEGKQLKLVIDGTRELKPAPWDEKVVGLHKQQTILHERGIGPGETIKYLSFEPSINLVIETTVKAGDYEMAEPFPGQPKRKLLRVVTTPEKIENVQLPALTTWVDADRNVIRSEVEVPGLGNLVQYRTTKANALAKGSPAQLTDIGLSHLVKLNARIARPFDTTAALYRVKVRGDESAGSTFANDARQKVRAVRGNSFELVVQSVKPGEDKEEKAAPEFTQSSYFINSDDGRVKSLARQAVGAEADPWRKALKVEKWVHANMTSKNHEALATADHVARTLEGDCTEFAMLTAAMCRAEGVPSRTAVGLVYAEVRGQPVFAFHMWTEVLIDGQWRSLDATLGLGRVGATHLKISSQSWHDERTQTPLLPVVRVLGRVEIEVVDVVGR